MLTTIFGTLELPPFPWTAAQACCVQAATILNRYCFVCLETQSHDGIVGDAFYGGCRHFKWGESQRLSSSRQCHARPVHTSLDRLYDHCVMCPKKNSAAFWFAPYDSWSRTPERYFVATQPAKFIQRQKQSTSLNPASRRKSSFARAVSGTSTPSKDSFLRSTSSALYPASFLKR
jgi:hypothetical protein